MKDLLSIAHNVIEFPDPTQVPDGQRAFLDWQQTFTPQMVLALVEFYESWDLSSGCELCGKTPHDEHCIVARIERLLSEVS